MAYQLQCKLLKTDVYQEQLPAFSGVDFSSLPQTLKTEESKTIGATYDPGKNIDFPLWENSLVNASTGSQSLPLQPSFSAALSDNLGVSQKQGQEIASQLFADGFGKRQEYGSHPQVREEWKVCSYIDRITPLIFLLDNL